MSPMNRRQCLKSFLNGVLQSAGTAVLASAVLPARAAANESVQPGKDLERRANELAEGQCSPTPDGAEYPISFVNGRFVNGGGGGGFRNGAFGNGGGGFRNVGFANGGFHNGGFVNGGFHNGGFVNGGFRNGGFANGGFVNGGFRNF
jgi:hypothetical protein